MLRDAKTARRVIVAVLVAGSLLPLLRIAQGGLWEPWELNRAEAARLVVEGEVSVFSIPEIHGEGERPPLATWVTAAGFAVGGAGVVMGKAAVAGFLAACIAAAVLLLRPFLAQGVAWLALVVFFTTPLVFFQGGSAGGDGVAFGAYAVAFAALSRLLERTRRGDAHAVRRELAVDLAATVVGLALSYFALGAALGVALPVTAAALAAVIGGGLPLPRRSAADADGIAAALRWGAVVAAVVLAVWFVVAVLAHGPDEQVDRFTLAVGGLKATLPLETFDLMLARLAYGLFPWCVLLPMAFAWVALPGGPEADDDGAGAGDAGIASEPAARHAALHALVAYPMLAYWNWRFHPAPVVFVFPVALLVARYLQSAATAGGGRALRAAGVVAAMLAVVVVRDAYSFSKEFLDVIGFPGAGDVVTEAPEFPIRLALSVAVMLAVVIVTHFAPQEPQEHSWHERCRRQLTKIREASAALRRGGGSARRAAIVALSPYAVGVGAWLSLLGVFIVARGTESGPFTLTHFGSWVVIGSLAAVPGIALSAVIRWRSALGSIRSLLAPLGGAPLAAGGLAVGLTVGLVVAPALDKGYSLAPAAEAAAAAGNLTGRLALFQVEPAAVNYYGALKGAEPVATVDEAADWLAGATDATGRRYLVLPARMTAINDVNQRFRDKRDGMLLPLLSDPGARYVLAASDLPEGFDNRSPLAAVIAAGPVAPMFPILGSSFEDKVEYLGYDIDTYPDGTVAAAQNVTITHFWKCTGRITGDYKVFVHIDGMGDRINGDHDPAGGLYPTRYWRPGDTIIDTQQIRIPFFARPARDPEAYRMYVGLFRGETRMRLAKGQGDDNRLWGGVIRVR